MKDKYKHLLNFAANIISLTVEAAMFGWVWYMLYVPMLDKANALFRRGNWAVIGMYALFVFFFTKVFGGYRIGYMRISDIILSQILAVILAMIVAFILSAVIGIVMGTGLTKPIRQLTSVIEQTAALDFRPTEAGAKLRKQKDEIGDMATKIHDMRKKLRAMMENLQQTQQVLETNTGNLNQLMKQNSAYAEDNSTLKHIRIASSEY